METAAAIGVTGREDLGKSVRLAAVAWILAAIYYFYQYALRSAPAVMMEELSSGFDITPLAVASIVGLFYYGYSPFSLIAGAAMDRLGPRRLLPGAAAAVGVGALLFATGNPHIASFGRLMQGAGGVFALVGAIYIATTNFAPSRAATLIGATQMFGMAGGAAGQFIVGPLIGHGLPWSVFWLAMGAGGLLIGVLLFVLLPKEKRTAQSGGWLTGTVGAFKVVFTNPQSILCGIIAGLLFIPTTIFDMIWGVRYLQEGHGLEYGDAVMRSAAVPFGWIIGCPLLGLISDRIGRRKPVIISASLILLACLTWILYGKTGVLPPFSVGIVAGIASGAAMLPYTVIKEANPTQFGGTATGVINFINFSFSALLAPVFSWALQSVSGGTSHMEPEHYQTVFSSLLYAVAIAIALTFVLRETGPAVRRMTP